MYLLKSGMVHNLHLNKNILKTNSLGVTPFYISIYWIMLKSKPDSTEKRSLPWGMIWCSWRRRSTEVGRKKPCLKWWMMWFYIQSSRRWFNMIYILVMMNEWQFQNLFPTQEKPGKAWITAVPSVRAGAAVSSSSSKSMGGPRWSQATWRRRMATLWWR